MNRYIVLSFVVMGFGYYELSGGSDFVAEQRPDMIAEAETATPDATAAEPDLAGIEVVTRADTATLDEIEAPDVEAIAIAPEALVEAVPEAMPESVAAAVADTVRAALDLREVAGDQVNMRDGPGTEYGVIDKLTQGRVVEVIEVGVDGWVRVQVENNGLTGWMSDQFLTQING